MMFGVLKYPRTCMYWQEKYRVNVIADNMTRNRFYELRSMFHVMNNLDIPPTTVINLYNLYLSYLLYLSINLFKFAHYTIFFKTLF